MRQVIKNPDSQILQKNLRYISGNTQNNRRIRNVLLEEQKCFCAYTDQYMGRTDTKCIDHFNPTLKGTPGDGYINWFLIKGQWNLEKSDKWEGYQPILHPTAADFDTRVIYAGGDYITNGNDQEADNLIRLLMLDDPGLADHRKKYIARTKDQIADSGLSAQDFFALLRDTAIWEISYPRAIQEEFGVVI